MLSLINHLVIFVLCVIGLGRLNCFLNLSCVMCVLLNFSLSYLCAMSIRLYVRAPFQKRLKVPVGLSYMKLEKKKKKLTINN